MPLTVGQLIDNKYEVLAELGQGGMGMVYKAWQLDLERTVAIKVLFPHAINTKAHGRLQREALALSQLRHPNVVSIYGCGVCDAGPYLVMEFVEGTPLSDEIDAAGSVDVNRTLSIMRKLCDAVGYTHRNGVVHRDLKPENVMLVGDPKTSSDIKLIDLGMARFLPESGRSVQKLTDTGFAVGSVMYMSPEECFAQKADYRSDIYSMGVIFYECLTGHPPFENSNMGEIMLAHVNKPPAPLFSEIGTAEVPGLQSVVFKAMAKRPDDRYQNVDELAADIKLVEGGGGGTIPRFTFGEPATSAAGRAAETSRNATPMVAMVAVALLTAAIGAAVWTKTSSGPSSLELYNQARRVYDAQKPDIKPSAVKLVVEALKRNELDHRLSVDQRLTAYVMFSSHSDDYARTASYCFDAVRLSKERGLADSKVYPLLQCLGWTLHHELVPVKRSEVINAMETALGLQRSATDSYADEVSWHLAKAYFGDGDFARAEKLANQIIAERTVPVVRTQMLPILAGCYLRAGDPARALNTFSSTERADLPNDDDYVEANSIIALAHLKQGNVEGAKLSAKKASGTPVFSGIQLLIAAKEGNWVESEKLYLTTLNEVRKHPSQYYKWFFDYDLSEYAKILAEAGKLDLARRTGEANQSALNEFKKTR